MERISAAASVSVSGGSLANLSPSPGGDSAETQHDQWTEHGFLRHPDGHLGSAGDHGLDDGRGHPGAESLHQRAVARPYLLGAVQLELDTGSTSSVSGRRV